MEAAPELRRHGLKLVASIGLGLALALPVAGTASEARAEVQGQTVTAERLIERWGIKIQGIRLSAAGYMLDFRYEVVDAEKAATLINPKLKPRLIDERRQLTLNTPVPPKVGPLRQTRAPIKAGRTYFMFFANPGKGVRAGDRVAITLGEITLAGLAVE